MPANNAARPLFSLFLRLFALLFILSLSGNLSAQNATVAATVYNGNPSNYLTQLDLLGPGDTLVLAAGTYTDGLPIYDMQGTAAEPIIITGPQSGALAVFQANSCICFNTIEIQDSSYVEIRNLELDGQQLNGVDAVKASGNQDTNWAHHITLENLYIHSHDNGQQTVGISTKIPAWDWVIRNNVIDSAGTGIYLGNSDGGAPFISGLIEGNVILDTPGYNMQIKHQNGRTAVPGMPTADGKTIIRHNVFSKANNAATGSNARPNVLVGHWPLSGSGQNDRYEIYGNFFYQNSTPEPLFQGEGNIALYNNLFFDDGPNGEAVWIQAHNDVPRAIDVFNNTIVASDFGLAVNSVDTNATQRVRGNAVFAPTPFDLDGLVQAADNITDTFANAGSYLVNPTGTAENTTLDLFPLAGTLTGSPINTSPFQSFTEWNLDFNGTVHNGTFRGAYAGEGSNPGWELALERKPLGTAVTYAISGTITETAVGLSGVSMTGTGADCTQTDGNGDYTCTVAAGWSGTLRPARPGYLFMPEERSYTAVAANEQNEDYTAVFALPYFIDLPIMMKP